MSDGKPAVLEKTVPIDPKFLVKAIALKCSDCYGSMALLNAITGGGGDEWHLCHNHTLVELLDEADRLGLDLTKLKAAVDPKPLLHSMYYCEARGYVTGAEAASWWQAIKNDRDTSLWEKLAEERAGGKT